MSEKDEGRDAGIDESVKAAVASVKEMPKAEDWMKELAEDFVKNTEEE